MDVIDTIDRDEAVEVVGLTFPGIEIHRDPDGGPFRFRHSRAARGAWTRTTLDIRGAVDAPGTYPDHIAVGRRHRGNVGIDYDRVELDTSRAYLRPRGPSVARFRDARVELLIVERPTFTAHAARLLEGSGRVVVDPSPDRSAPLSQARSRLWNATMDTLAPMFSADAPAAEAVLAELATAALLVAFPLTAERASPAGTGVLPRAMRRATEFVDAHLADAITVGMIADAAGLSVRSVQEGFRRYLDTTPIAYVRTARLRAVHRSLSETVRGDDTVAGVARRYGFTHPSRFARDYFREFGEHPSHTLRS